METVDDRLEALKHPMESEIQAVRGIIKGVDERITEEWKWNAPSFSYKGYLVTFHLHAKDRVHLVFHNGAILDDQGGSWKVTIRTGGWPISPTLRTWKPRHRNCVAPSRSGSG